jgi:hypothetical protein
VKDPVVHDRDLNEAFRSDIPKKPEPVSDSETKQRIPWVTVVPKFSYIRGVQITEDNIEDISTVYGYQAERGNSTRYLFVPTTTASEVKAYIGDWILVADGDWNNVTVCSGEAFTRNYEVET